MTQRCLKLRSSKVNTKHKLATDRSIGIFTAHRTGESTMQGQKYTAISPSK